MELHDELLLDIELEPPMMVGDGPLGTRIIASVANGTASGERINGRVVGAGADWMLMGKDGFARIDVRCQVRTDDGAVIYLRYEGLLELNEVALGALMTPGAETSWGDQYFRTTPVLESGDERYNWVNRTLFVARGRVTGQGIEYEMSRVG